MRLFRPLLLLTACVLIISAAAHAQDQLKVIEWADHREITGRIDETWLRHIETVELEAILINGKIVTIGETFPAGIDWVNELTFRVKNVSADDIAFVQITLTLPELKHSPQIPYLAPCGNKANQPCLRSGEQADLKIHSRKLYEWVKEQVAKERELSTINRVAIYAVFATSRNAANVMAGCIRTLDVRNACPH